MAGRTHVTKKKTARKRWRVAVVTGTRAEFGLLRPVIDAIKARRDLDVRLIVTGMHLLRKFGHTIDHILEAGYRVDETVRMQTGKDDVSSEPTALARGIKGLAQAFDDVKADMVLVLGDRIEAFAAASAARSGRRVLAHIHGGDRAMGDLDDLYRDAISRLADLHLVASEDAARRLERMGEPTARIHRIGAPGLDVIRAFRQKNGKSPRATDRWLNEELGIIAERSYAVVIQHPTGRSRRLESATMRNLLRAVARADLAGVIIYPNSDPGHLGVIDELSRLDDPAQWRVYPSLTQDAFLRVCSRARLMVGNSSSGIIESASLGLAAVNVGERQAGRLRCGPCVIDAGESTAAIGRAIARALRSKPPAAGRGVYGDGRAGPRIARILARFPSKAGSAAKRLAY